MKAIPIYIHIPRTGGTSLRHYAESQYDKSQILTLYGDDIYRAKEVLEAISPESYAHYKLIRGHISYGCHTWISAHTEYFTFLRHPLDRVWSLYKYMQRDRGHPFHGLAMNLTLTEMIDEKISTEFDNGMVRQLCGFCGEFPQSPDVPASIPFGELEEHHFQVANHNLQKFEVVGSTEAFRESMVEVAKWLDWNLSSRTFWANKSKPGAARNLSRAAKMAIRECNLMDEELYLRATGRITQWAY